MSTKDPMGRVPVTIVTGFLGSGKTTLLNHLLTSGNLGRTAALVNDFGAIDIDGALISAVADTVVQLANGCVCCTINADLLGAAERVLGLDPPVDRIVVETTGLADPLPVGLTFLQTYLRRRCVLEAVVTVVDAANFALDLTSADAAMAQIVHGDVIVLNKSDLVDAAVLDALTRRIGIIKPRARILRAAYGRIAPAAVTTLQGEPSLVHATAPEHRHHLLDDGFTACAFRCEGQLRGSAFQEWLDRGLPSKVFRAKGILHFEGSAQGFVFHYCAGRSSFEPYEGPIENTRIVFIGEGLTAAEVEPGWQTCLVAAARALAA